MDFAQLLQMPYETVLIIYKAGKEKKKTLGYIAIPVKLPGYDHPLCWPG